MAWLEVLQMLGFALGWARRNGAVWLWARYDIGFLQCRSTQPTKKLFCCYKFETAFDLYRRDYGL